MSEWLEKWKKKGWKKNDGKAILNLALWQELDKQNQQKTIEWQWVKAHSNIRENELCDKMARAEIKKFKK